MTTASPKTVAGIVNNQLSSGVPKETLISSLASYLVKTRQTKSLPRIMRLVKQYRQQSAGIVEIDSTTARGLDSAAKAKIANLFEATAAVFNETIDPAILAGGRFESIDKRLDLAASTKLGKLRNWSK